jgi:hypothetical protein
MKKYSFRKLGTAAFVLRISVVITDRSSSAWRLNSRSESLHHCRGTYQQGGYCDKTYHHTTFMSLNVTNITKLKSF